MEKKKRGRPKLSLEEKQQRKAQALKLVEENQHLAGDTITKGGRPTKYQSEYCEKLIDFMSQGYSYEAFAGKLRVAKSTLYEWEKNHSEFSNAKKIAFGVNRVFWERMGIDNLVNLSRGDSLNQTVWIFNMKNRFNWRDKVETETQVSLSDELKDLADKLPD